MSAPARPVATDPELGQNRDFKVMLAGQGASSIGDAVTFTVLPILVLTLTGSGLAMGVVGVLQTIPHLVVGMLAGAFADRSDRRRMMLLADLGRAVLTALIPLSALLGIPTMAVILLVAAPESVLGTIFLAAYTAATPALVGRSRIGTATAVFEAVYSFGYIVGPIIAGVLVGVVGPTSTLGIDAASFLLSALALALVRRPLVAPPDRPPTHILTDVREGIAYVAHHPMLRPLIIFWTTVSIVSAPLVPVLTFLITKDRGLPATSLGAILAAFGVGTVLGSLLTVRLVRGRAGVVMLTGNLARGALLLGVAFAPEMLVVLPLAFVAGLADSMVLVTYISVRAAAAPDELIGRVGSTMRTISVGLQPVGMVVGGILLDLSHGAATLAGMGVLLIGITLVFAPSRALREVRLRRAH
ncbi:MAG TPA: MFS transporter [Candidatus Acidoferrum sp.]|nr:MFS transporter [Candidatus Acidoferrum sp.]